ncbi:MAG: hypothetical protein VX694_07130 [Planctomycetota bacterium]|nr:hypothetical protein [Planctomycetota bacterium]
MIESHGFSKEVEWRVARDQIISPISLIATTLAVQACADYGANKKVPLLSSGQAP